MGTQRLDAPGVRPVIGIRVLRQDVLGLIFCLLSLESYILGHVVKLILHFHFVLVLLLLVLVIVPNGRSILLSLFAIPAVYVVSRLLPRRALSTLSALLPSLYFYHLFLFYLYRRSEVLK